MPTRHQKTEFILHLGAGRCELLDAYLETDAAQIVLVEPHPDRAARLERRIRGRANVELIPQAVSARSGTALLLDLNLPGYASLRRPTGLNVLYPGLRIKREIEVEAVTIRTLLESRALLPNQGNRLVIDTPGEESDIIDALLEHGDLAVFDRIDLHCGEMPLYEGSSEAAAIIRLLEQEGYEIASLDRETDPDRPRWSLRRNALAIENKELKKQLAEAIAARDDQGQRASAREARMQELEAQQADDRAKGEQLTAKLESAQNDLALALRLQMLRENDLEELQARYSEVLTIKGEQQDLLAQLHDRLSRAAEYLQLGPPQSDGQQLPDELLQALTGKPEQSGGPSA